MPRDPGHKKRGKQNQAWSHPGMWVNHPTPVARAHWLSQSAVQELVMVYLFAWAQFVFEWVKAQASLWGQAPGLARSTIEKLGPPSQVRRFREVPLPVQ